MQANRRDASSRTNYYFIYQINDARRYFTLQLVAFVPTFPCLCFGLMSLPRVANAINIYDMAYCRCSLAHTDNVAAKEGIFEQRLALPRTTSSQYFILFLIFPYTSRLHTPRSALTPTDPILISKYCTSALHCCTFNNLRSYFILLFWFNEQSAGVDSDGAYNNRQHLSFSTPPL